ncbi:MAG: HEPN domain-containing protein [Candidatus Bathyarchaeia archaeon]|nr:HEPN domain-containing protein [Candidatus Bathyarchaeota archaeon]
MKLNPLSEVRFRVKLAERYLEEAERAYRIEDYRAAVGSSQLSVENAAKAVIALYRIPSWSHDPSHELEELIDTMPEEVRHPSRELASTARRLAPEHGRATYGEPSRGLTPWDLYSREDAYSALNDAREALKRLSEILEKLKVHL